MKKRYYFIRLTIDFINQCCAFGQHQCCEHDWMATIKVIDENSQPVTGATVAVSVLLKPPARMTKRRRKLHGPHRHEWHFPLSHAATGSISLAFDAEK